MKKTEKEIHDGLKKTYLEIYKPQITGAATGTVISSLITIFLTYFNLSLEESRPILSFLNKIFSLFSASMVLLNAYCLYDINNKISKMVERQTKKIMDTKNVNLESSRVNLPLIECENVDNYSATDFLKKAYALENFVCESRYIGYEDDLLVLRAVIDTFMTEIEKESIYFKEYYDLMATLYNSIQSKIMAVEIDQSTPAL